MKCFYSGSDAIGLCKSCGRGLALACATEFPNGLACKSRCEATVRELSEASQKQKEAAAALVTSTQVTTAASGVFSMLAGGGFLYFNRYSPGMNLINFMGGAFILFGLYSFLRAVRLLKRRRPAARDSTPPHSPS
jgi:hypothetical protein